MANEQSLPDWLYSNRTKRGLTQAAVADEVGNHQTTINSWEIGRSYPRADALRRLRDFFNSTSGPENHRAPVPDMISGADEPTVDEENRYGDWIQATLDRKRMDVVTLAGRSGLTPATIYNILSGRVKNPQQDTRKYIAQGLEESVPEAVQSEILEENSAGEFGELIGFDPRNPSIELQTGGLYVFYDRTNRPVYVGISANIYTRMINHRSTSVWFASPLVIASGRYIVVVDEQRRRSLEKLMIKFLRSSAMLNKQHRES